jgi:hypothetical protein
MFILRVIFRCGHKGDDMIDWLCVLFVGDGVKGRPRFVGLRRNTGDSRGINSTKTCVTNGEASRWITNGCCYSLYSQERENEIHNRWSNFGIKVSGWGEYFPVRVPNFGTSCRGFSTISTSTCCFSVLLCQARDGSPIWDEYKPSQYFKRIHV